MKYGARAAGYAGWRWLMFWLLCVAVLLPVQALQAAEDAADVPAGIITAIEFTGNRVTQPQIMLQEMLVKEGDVADPALIERSRQSIMDLGLFVSVRAVVEPRADGSVLHIYVKEKYYILPVPKLNRDEDNNFSYGAELSLDNVAGLNQQLKIKYETDNATGLSGGQINTNSFSYNYPRVLGSAYLFRTDISQQKSPAEVLTGSEVSSLYNFEAWTVSLQVSRWLNRTGPSRGWQVGTGVVLRRNAYDYVSGTTTDTFQDAQAVGLTLSGKFIDVRDYLFSREGLEYGYNGEFGVPTLGSDTQYTRHEFFYRKYVLLEGRPHENIDLQARLGLSSGDIFPSDGYAYSIGGSRTLRGYSSGSFPGNAFVLFNIQYLRPFFGYYPLRGALFLDVGNAYPSNEEINLGDLKWSVGIGFRLRLKSFVKIDLRVDASCVHDTGECKLFAGTKEIF